FNSNYNSTAQAYLAGLRGKLSTRLGTAMRHGVKDLKSQHTHRRLMLVISDGEPSDIDVDDRSYLVEDARKVVRSLSRLGIDVFCVGLEKGAENYLNRIFGRKNYTLVSNLSALPARLTNLYFRLTA
ncbi:MAG: VWA domain-containing protein, partial [Bacteroidota bacterium]